MATTKVKVDLRDTEGREGKKRSGARKHYKPGDYAVKCVKAVLGQSSEKKSKRIELTYRFMEGKNKGKDIHDDLYLSAAAAWRVRQTLEAMGMKVPSKIVNLDLNHLKGKTLAVTLDDDEYEGKAYSVVTDAYLLSEFRKEQEDAEGDEDEDEDEDEEEDEEDEDSEDEEDEDEDEEEDDEDEEDEDEDELEGIDLDDL